MSQTDDTMEARGTSPPSTVVEPLATVRLDVRGLVEQILAMRPRSAVAVFDREIRIVHVAGEALARSGWVPDAAVGRRLIELLDEPTLSVLGPHYRRTLTGEASELEFVSPATGRAYTQQFSPIRDESGEVVLGITAWTEFTEARKMEQELAESEQRFRQLAERGADVLMLFDRELRVTYVSPAIERIAGWSPEEFGRAGPNELIHPDDVAEIGSRAARLFAGEPLPPWAFRLRRADGGYVWIEGVDSPVTDPATGEIVGVQESGRDVTERRRAEQLFETIAELAPVGIFRADSEGRLIYVNRRWTEIAGLSLEEAAGEGWKRIVHPDDLEPAIEAWTGVADSWGELTYDFRYLRPDGEVRYVRTATAQQFDESGELIGQVGSVTDVTGLKKAEEERLAFEAQLQQAQKLESLGVLAGGVAHDFNNLLVGVLGNAALALGELPSDGPARRSIEQIESAARRAAELTRQMLAYSGKGRFVIERADVSALVSDTVRLISAALGATVTLRLDLPEGLPPVEGDITQLRQLVMNLVVNAGEAISGPGVVEVSVGVADVGPDVIDELVAGTEIDVGRYIVLRVVDTGVGMDTETLSRIFEPFFTTKFTGRGLGLAATLGIVRGHHGGLAVESEPGRGTAFTVYLPFVLAEAQAAAEPEEQSVVAVPGLVLVVDDDELVRTVVGRMLDSQGVDCVLASGGEEALLEVEARPRAFGAVILDLAMPGLVGADLVDALRRAGLTAPIVVMSGHAEEDVSDLLVHHGVAGFIQKPFAPGDLVAALRAAIAG